MLGLLAGCAYFSFKLYRIYQQKTTTYAHVYKVSVWLWLAAYWQ
jgi:hypothetical protein